MNFLLFAALLLDADGMAYNAEFHKEQDGVLFVDYERNQAETGIDGNGLFIRASYGFVGELTHFYPPCGTVVWLACFREPTKPEPPIIDPPEPPIVDPIPDPPASVPEPATLFAGYVAVLLGAWRAWRTA